MRASRPAAARTEQTGLEKTLTTPLTVAEATDYRATSRHADVLSFIAALAPRAHGLSVQSMGASARSADIPLLVLSADGAFTPVAAAAAAAANGRPVVLLLANIHAGEVEGKESALKLAREIGCGPLGHLVERATLLIVPDYNPDGNDLIDPANRALDLAKLEGQIGPAGGVGTRLTAHGVNLNRDYMKLAAVESRHLARLYGEWRPHLTIDCHTTNGSIHGYHLTYDTARLLASSPPAPILHVRDVLLPEVSRRLVARTGFRTFFYGNFRDQENPEAGWETYPALPRFGSHYRGLTGRMDILLEAYSYIPFRERCTVMFETLVEILGVVRERGDEIVCIVAEAETETIRRGSAPAPDDVLGLRTAEVSRDPATGAVTLAYPLHPAGEVEIVAWDLESQRARRVPGRELRTYRTTYYGRSVPTKLARRPFAYLIPAAEARVAEHLTLHGIVVERIEREMTIAVEEFVIDATGQTASTDIAAAAPPETLFFGHLERAEYTASPGDFLVPMGQRLAHVAIYLLEPESDDGLVEWGFFPALGAGDVYPVRRISAVMLEL